MRKLYLLLLAVVCTCAVRAQVNNYSFSESMGTYTPVTGGTLVAEATGTSSTAGLDNVVYNATLPFAFTFNNTSYTSINISTNGYITFGATAPSTTTTTPISTTTAYDGAASALGADLRGVLTTTGVRTTGSNEITGVATTAGISAGDVITGTGIPTGTTVVSVSGSTITMSAAATTSSTAATVSVGTGEIRTETIGTGPNRTFVIQFSNFQRSGTTNSVVNFQIRLNEGGGVASAQTVQFVYGTTTSPTASSAQVGLRGATNADFNNRTSTTSWTGTAKGTTNTASMTWSATVFPPEGLTYTYTPATCFSPTAVTFVSNTPTSATFNWTAPGGDPVLQYEYELRTSGGPGSGATGLASSGTVTGTTLTVTGLTPNTAYALYLRTACTTGAFSVYTSATPASTRENDFCPGARPLAVNSDLGCAFPLTDSTTLATQSMAACAGTADDDVWFRFTATNAVHRVKIINKVALAGGTSTDMLFQVFSGTCGTLTSLVCSDPDSANVYNLTPGTEYYVRVYNWSNGNYTQFDICVGTPPPPPANDNCTAPVTLTPSAGTTCTNTRGTTFNATPSPDTAPTCSATGTNDDVWYSFTATGPSHVVNLSTTTSTAAVAVYSGACGSLTQLAGACGSGGTGVNGLTAGQTYLVRVYTTTSTTTTGTDFDICIVTPVANDECAGAIGIPVAATGTCTAPTAGTTDNATASTDAAPTCSATGTNDDVWFSFVATGPTHNVVIADATSTTAAAVYSGACGSLTQVTNACASSGVTVATGLSAGTTYYVRVYTTSTTASTFSTFNICVTTPPANDNCNGSVSLPVSTTTACTSPTAGTTAGATPSPDAAPSCSGTGINDDVWYSFVASSTAHTVMINNATSTTAAAIYSGSCGALTAVSCGSTVAQGTGLTPGNTYYVRVYTTSSTVTTSATFDICVISTPANDNCSGAVGLPAPSATTACTSSTAGSTLGATQSPDAAPTCSATGINDDVWFTFVASGPAHNVVISDATSTTAAAVYSGACGSLTQVANACGTTVANATGLTPGATYYVRVYTTSTTVGTVSNFNICLTSPPANDNCSGAIALPAPSATSTCSTPTSGSTLGATPSAETAPTCSATGTNDDVWYSFVASSTSHSVALSNASTTTAVAVYSGACGSLAQVNCGSTNAPLTGLTVGNTYYVRVYTTSTATATSSTFDLCVAALPTNDECTTAQSLTASSSCTPVGGSTIGATASTETAPTCSATGTNDDVWYSFVATATSHLVSTSNASNAVAVAVYSGACGSLTQVGCATGSVTVNALTMGNTYYVRVYTTSTTATTYATFNICVTQPLANDDCAGAVAMTQQPFSATPTNTVVNTQTATLSSNTSSCFSTSNDDDVWFSFTPTNSTLVMRISNFTAVSGTPGGFNYGIYTGTCAGLTESSCSLTETTNGDITVSGLTVGTQYYLRALTNGTGGRASFNLALMAPAPLPVTLVAFSGEKNNNTSLLKWTTSSEQGSSGFHVERSTDRVTFAQIGFVASQAANGSSASPLHYTFVDKNATGSRYYYRLRQADADGKTKYSSVVLVRGEKVSVVTLSGVYPNPASSKVTVLVDAPSKNDVTIRITDLTGRTVAQRKAVVNSGSNTFEVAIGNLVPGMYLLRLDCADGCDASVQKFIRQ